MTSQSDHNPAAVLRAKRRMAFFLLVLVFLFLLGAGLTDPFETHTSPSENIIYGLIVAGPFIIINIIFIFITGKDLKRM